MKEFVITDFSHDWAIVFSCQTKKFYEIDLYFDALLSDQYEDWVNEICLIESMTSKEFFGKYGDSSDIEILSPLNAFLEKKKEGFDGEN